MFSRMRSLVLSSVDVASFIQKERCDFHYHVLVNSITLKNELVLQVLLVLHHSVEIPGLAGLSDSGLGCQNVKPA